MIKTIKFTLNPYRKNTKSNFDGRLSGYWQRQYEDCFRKWRG